MSKQSAFIRLTIVTTLLLQMTRTILLAFNNFAPAGGCRRIVYFLLLFIVGSQFEATAGEHRASNASVRPAVLFHNYCSVCHGEKGNGQSRAQNSLNPPPLDFTTSKAAQIPRARMIDSVTNGRPGTAMTAWKTQLNPKEIESLVDYVRDTFMPASTSADSSRGRAVYGKYCSVCHGEKGDGRSRAQASLNPPPRDFTAPESRAELSKQRMITSATFGRANTAMAGFKTQLSPEDINAVVDYIRSGFMAGDSTEGISGTQHGRRQASSEMLNAPTKSTPPAPKVVVAKPVVVNMAAPMPSGLTGNVTKGEVFYMSNCATCHGSSGDGRGPRAYFINPKPRDFLHPASRQEFNRVKLFKMISEGERGTEMPAWNKVLSPQEIANVAEFVFQRFIQADAGKAKAAKTEH
jgi:cbb3-type cytochrome c oxidase subunit III